MAALFHCGCVCESGIYFYKLQTLPSCIAGAHGLHWRLHSLREYGVPYYAQDRAELRPVDDRTQTS